MLVDESTDQLAAEDGSQIAVWHSLNDLVQTNDLHEKSRQCVIQNRGAQRNIVPQGGDEDDQGCLFLEM